MIRHEVRVHPSAARLPRERQLAWKLAELARLPALDADTAELVGARVVDNASLAAQLGCEPDWIFNVSGIAERRYADSSETLIDLAERAAVDCLSPDRHRQITAIRFG